MSGSMNMDFGSGDQSKRHDGAHWPSGGNNDHAITRSNLAGSVQKPLMSMLQRTIEAEVIPRLMLLNGITPVDAAAEARDPASVVIRDSDVATFADIARVGSFGELVAMLRRLLAHGVSTETLLLNLLAPAARHLGEMWANDTCSFADVSIGLSRLQQAMRLLAPPAQESGDDGDSLLSVLLTPFPGDRHTFGVAMVQQFFVQSGWQVTVLAPDGVVDIVAAVNRKRYSLVGIALAQEELLARLAAAIETIRHESLNPAIGVLVGGPAFIGHADRCATVGADATGSDARQAVIQARSLLGLTAARC